MAARRPMNDADMQQISGVGERKLQLYGDAFMQAIRDFVAANSASIKDGSTSKLSLELFRQGLTIEQIATKRELAARTIYSHLAQLYEAGEAIDLKPFISPADIQTIVQALKYLEKPFKLKDIYDRFDGKYQYHQIHFALAHHRRQDKTGALS